MAKVHKATYWFAWRPVQATDTGKFIWLKKVYREWWYDKLYFEHPSVTGKET